MELSSKEMDSEDLYQLSLELAETINSETDLEADLEETAGVKGDRGDVVAIGQIILTALTSGTVVTLFNVLKAYFNRRPTLEVKFKHSNGNQFSIKASQLSKDQMEKTIKLANQFFEGKDG
jgi:hypothetical protein